MQAHEGARDAHAEPFRNSFLCYAAPIVYFDLSSPLTVQSSFGLDFIILFVSLKKDKMNN